MNLSGGPAWGAEFSERHDEACWGPFSGVGSPERPEMRRSGRADSVKS